MTSHSVGGSVPAGRPILQDIDYTVSYDYVVVTTEYLREMKVMLAEAPDSAKYSIYRALLYYGNIRRWQKQGLHFLYEDQEDTKHCTCGLVLNVNGSSDQEIAVVISPEVHDKLGGLELDQVQRVKGHVGLPTLKGTTVALIVNGSYKDSIADYLWSVFCQKCGEYQVGLKSTKAKSFVKAHDKICGPGIFKKWGK